MKHACYTGYILTNTIISKKKLHAHLPTHCNTLQHSATHTLSVKEALTKLKHIYTVYTHAHTHTHALNEIHVYLLTHAHANALSLSLSQTFTRTHTTH